MRLSSNDGQKQGYQSRQTAIEVLKALGIEGMQSILAEVQRERVQTSKKSHCNTTLQTERRLP